MVDFLRRVYDGFYVWIASLTIGAAIDLLALLDQTYQNLFQLISILSICLTLERISEWLLTFSAESPSTLMTLGSALFSFSVLLRFCFRYVIYSDLQEEHSSLSQGYLSYWKSRVFYRERLGWREDDVVDNHWVCLLQTQLLILNVAELFWDYALVALVNTVTGICFVSLSLLLFCGYVIASLALYLVLVSIFLSFCVYVVLFPFDLLGALLTHHLSSSDLFVFHLLRGNVSLLERYLRWVYSLHYPLSRWIQFKPNYAPLSTVVVFLFAHVFTGSRAFVLVDDLSYRDLSSSPQDDHQKYLQSSVEEPAEEGEVEEESPYRLLLSPLSIMIMMLECLFCTASAILIAIDSLPTWRSYALIACAVLSLVADLTVLRRLYAKRRSQENRVVADARMSQSPFSAPGEEADLENK
jgi:hypothetical protein